MLDQMQRQTIDFKMPPDPPSYNIWILNLYEIKMEFAFIGLYVQTRPYQICPHQITSE